MLKIHSIETFGTHEGPGIRVIVFMQGCLMKCLYCHNPDTISLNGGKEIEDEEIIKITNKVKPYFGNKGGITFSGGEALLQAKSLISTCKKLKELGYNIIIDTNGFILNDDVKELLNYIDIVLLDIKHLYEESHIKLTGVSNKSILEFANFLEKNDKNFWIRHVLVPGHTDDKKHLEDLGIYFSNFKNLDRFEILPYHTLGVHKWRELGFEYGLKDILPPTNEELLEAKSILEKNLKKVFIRR